MKKILLITTLSLITFIGFSQRLYKITYYVYSTKDSLTINYKDENSEVKIKTIVGDWSYYFEVANDEFIVYLDVFNVTNRFKFNIQTQINDKLIIPYWQNERNAVIYVKLSDLYNISKMK